MKAAMPEITANDRLRARLCGDILDDKLAHAYIIEGSAGTGRHLLALSVAAAVACENRSVDGLPLPCHRCEACRKIFSGISPDVTVIGRGDGKASLGVDSVRFIRSDAPVMPNDLEIKVYIISDADTMTAQAQNALLLTLEEPPRHVLLLLICENAGLLLETVRSRAPVLRTEPVPPELMREHLLNRAPETEAVEAARMLRASPAEFAELVQASSGSIGRAYELLKRETRVPVLEARAQVREFTSSLLRGRSGTEVFGLLASFPQKRDELSERLGLICLSLRDLIVLKKSDDADLCFYSDREEAASLSDSASLALLLRLESACEEANISIIKNANIKLTLFNLVTSAGK